MNLNTFPTNMLYMYFKWHGIVKGHLYNESCISMTVGYVISLSKDNQIYIDRIPFTFLNLDICYN